MAVNFPNDRREVVDRIKTDVQSALPSDAAPFIPNSWLSALCTGVGGRVYDFYLMLKQVLFQIFMDTATGIYISQWGSYVKVTKNPATYALGFINIIGNVGITVPINTIFASPTGQQYTTNNAVDTAAVSHLILSLTRSGSTATATLATPINLANGMTITISGATQTQYNGNFIISVLSSTVFQYTLTGSPVTPATGTILSSFNGAIVEVTSQNTGNVTDLENGALLAFGTPIVGLQNNAIVSVSDIGGGADVESDDDYRARVIYRYQNPHALFNAAEITSIAMAITGVTRVWVFNCVPVIGDVTIAFTRDNDANPIPDPTEVNAVYQAILAVKPADMEDDYIHVDAPTPIEVDFTFTELTPNTPAMQKAIQDNLAFFFLDSGEVGAFDNSTSVLAESYLSVIAQTVDAQGNQLQSFTLTEPTGNISVPFGSLPLFESANFP